jgi:hypothetical protein
MPYNNEKGETNGSNGYEKNPQKAFWSIRKFVPYQSRSKGWKTS